MVVFKARSDLLRRLELCERSYPVEKLWKGSNHCGELLERSFLSHDMRPMVIAIRARERQLLLEPLDEIGNILHPRLRAQLLGELHASSFGFGFGASGFRPFGLWG